MMIIKVINILQFEVIKMIVLVTKIHTKRVKNTSVMSKNNNRKGSVVLMGREF